MELTEEVLGVFVSLSEDDLLAVTVNVDDADGGGGGATRRIDIAGSGCCDGFEDDWESVWGRLGVGGAVGFRAGNGGGFDCMDEGNDVVDGD